MKKNKLYCQDCIQGMKELEPNSIDAVITDSPYGLEFMGKDWDKFKEGKNIAGGNTGKNTPYARSKSTPAFYQLTANDKSVYQQFTFNWGTEALRVLKPGGYLLSFGGTRTYHRMVCGIEDAGFEIRDCIMWIYASGFPKSLNIGKTIDKWEGWSTGLKPAVEPIVVARKPFKGTVADNVLKYGTGGLNIDVSRIPHIENLSTEGDGHKLDSNNQGWGFKSMARGNEGRYPSNIILDDVSADILGGASRFFYVAKVSKRERNMGCSGLKEGCYMHDGRKKDCDMPAQRTQLKAHNIHPCVKPLQLMEYLVKLVCPPSGLVLDPFAGSGTTLMACKRTGCDYIGFEKDKEYCDIAKARIKATVSLHGWI